MRIYENLCQGKLFSLFPTAATPVWKEKLATFVAAISASKPKKLPLA